MKKLFFYLLKKYSKTEKDRLKILSILSDEIHNEYNEQTNPGNVYNFFIEFIMSNYFIRTLHRKGDTKSLRMIKTGIDHAFDESLDWLSKEKFTDLYTFNISEKVLNNSLLFLKSLSNNHMEKIEVLGQTFNGNVELIWKNKYDEFYLDIGEKSCSYYYEVNGKKFIYNKQKINKNINDNLLNFYNKNRVKKLKNILKE